MSLVCTQKQGEGGGGGGGGGEVLDLFGLAVQKKKTRGSKGKIYRVIFAFELVPGPLGYVIRNKMLHYKKYFD
jgi:hypothetical protein